MDHKLNLRQNTVCSVEQFTQLLVAIVVTFFMSEWKPDTVTVNYRVADQINPGHMLAFF